MSARAESFTHKLTLCFVLDITTRTLKVKNMIARIAAYKEVIGAIV